MIVGTFGGTFLVEFEWDEIKRQRILAMRGLDFVVAHVLFDGRPPLTAPSPRSTEERWLSIGEVNGVFLATIWTWRDERIRIITMRRARDGEKREYQALYGP